MAGFHTSAHGGYRGRLGDSASRQSAAPPANEGGDGTAGDLLLRMLGSSPSNNGSVSSTSARQAPLRPGTVPNKGMPSPPSPPKAPEGGDPLKALLSRVAPQARITETADFQLTTKASGRILAKVLGEASGSSAPGASMGSERRAMKSNAGGVHTNGARNVHAHGYGGRQHGRPHGRPSREEALPEWATEPVGPVDPFFFEASRPQPYPDDAAMKQDDEDDQFMQRWSGLFSKGSPLVEGTARDPFKDDLRERKEGKVDWKKDRRGHRQRYQQRRQERESAKLDSAEHAKTDLDQGVSLVYDAYGRRTDPDEGVSFVYDAFGSKPDTSTPSSR
eukprot:TRINITY_DN31746_c0_g1_i1.p1 TRINITY_DN31746_c0_g1~~TRINITY_DN31746_c0_g1_i1.p1  ORF type:complete len:345 (-),score=59.16 TRINITY_DN31746_c0_g1_i1:936-1934(-)